MIKTVGDRVILDLGTYSALVTRANRGERVARELRAALRARQTLLNTAIHELALERGAKDPQYFRRLWLREKGGA